jgi:nitroimidazol reductase NimA-like FMN-containing flavoprotein (pyridoxamine 5'-phosphate oxidase superfamily)
MTDEMRAPEQGELDRTGCLTLLLSQRVGRVGLPGPEASIVPVNYVFVGGAVVFRTDGGSRAGAHEGELVVFEVDGIDPVRRAGWSVTVRGRLTDAADVIAADTAIVEMLDTWAPGPKNRCFRIVIDEVTGRWVHGAETPRRPGRDGYL